MKNMNGRVCQVTGGSTGIGKETATRFVRLVMA
jgi:NAD(P)-dependent dehydrogenase (short-subunit alcohol dehydrogenase family)